MSVLTQFAADARDFLPILLQGCAVTIELTLAALVLSTLLGFAWALMRLSPYAVLRWPAISLITVIRGIPIIVQLFYMYFVLPDLGIQLSAFQAGFIGLGIAYSSYQAENFRAGIQAVDHGQVEAAQSLGMRPSLVMRRVVLPQAIRVFLPPYGNTMIMMLKDSSIASAITVAELTRGGQLIAASTFKNMTVFTLVALLYLTMSLPLTLFAHWLERRFGRK
ncbi:MAG TPA: amino acid ABC transporter permease [Casimicrobiaceae bacterium]|nr:amino acid ABC transporter permease [Casimicrobiaceae bacterium]